MKKKYFIVAIVILLMLWIGAFLGFLICVHKESQNNELGCNNMAILTGGKNRMADAMSFLEDSPLPSPLKVLISGVDLHTTIQDIFGNNSPEHIDFTLGKEAKNTRGNAREIINWMKNNNMQEITVITSDYHMPRSLLEIKHLDPNIKIYRHHLITARKFKFIFYCFLEFHKIILAHIRHFLRI
ncbi:MAG: YdcF family protein [Holosporaceae bacterium]|nr:YdcF family protein [Holosporaceae bacterium]